MFVVYLLSDFLTSGSSDNYQNSVVAGGEGRAGGGGTGTWIPHNCPTGQLSPYCMCCFSINVEIQ